jgi:hypothetical protein
MKLLRRERAVGPARAKAEHVSPVIFSAARLLARMVQEVAVVIQLGQRAFTGVIHHHVENDSNAAAVALFRAGQFEEAAAQARLSMAAGGWDATRNCQNELLLLPA